MKDRSAPFLGSSSRRKGGLWRHDS